MHIIDENGMKMFQKQDYFNVKQALSLKNADRNLLIQYFELN